MNMTVFKDFSYGTHERQKADIYIPEKPVSQSGLILFIHGGGGCNPIPRGGGCLERLGE